MTPDPTGGHALTPRLPSQLAGASSALTPTPSFRIRYAGAPAPARTPLPRRPSPPPSDVDTMEEEDTGGLYDDDVAISRTSGIEAAKAGKRQVRGSDDDERSGGREGRQGPLRCS